MLCCNPQLSRYHPRCTLITLCADIADLRTCVCVPGIPTFSISVLLPRNLSSQLEMKSRKSDLSLLSSVSSSSFGGMRVSVMKALYRRVADESGGEDAP